MSCSEWKEYSLGDICEYRKQKISIDKINVDNYISTENMLQDKKGITVASSIPNAKSVDSYLNSDVLISNIRPYFKKIWYADKIGGASNDVLIFYTLNKDVLNSKYLYYLLSSDDFFDYVMSTSKGTKMPRGDKEAIMNYKVELPPLEEQEKIVDVLSSLDHNIELNNEMNKTLDEMAQSIFKRWFVDFEFPNEDGEPYKSSGGEMVESELGMIPKGWEVTNIDDICIKVTSGGTPSRKNKDYYDGDIIWIKTKELNDTFLFDSEEKISSIGLEKSSAKLFPPKTVMIAMYGATVGKLGISSTMITFNQATCGMVVNTEVCCYEYLYLHLINQREKLKNLAIGSAQQNLSVSVIKEYNIIKPIKQIIEKFKNIIKPIYDKIECNQNNTQSLKSLRDELLPKLMRNEKK